MKPSLVLVYFSLLPFLKRCTAFCDQCKIIHLKPFDDLLVSNSPIWSRTSSKSLTCAKLCYYDNHCVSFHFNKEESSCVGFSLSFSSPPRNNHTTGTTNKPGNKLFETCKDVPFGYVYLGCYEDKSTRILDTLVMISKMTIEMCLDTCQADGYIYSGMEYSTSCLCGNNKQEGCQEKTEDKCSSRCAGNSSQTCGGSWHVSLFKMKQIGTK